MWPPRPALTGRRQWQPTGRRPCVSRANADPCSRSLGLGSFSDVLSEQPRRMRAAIVVDRLDLAACRPEIEAIDVCVDISVRKFAVAFGLDDGSVARAKLALDRHDYGLLPTCIRRRLRDAQEFILAPAC